MIFDKALEFDWHAAVGAGVSYSANAIDIGRQVLDFAIGVQPVRLGFILHALTGTLTLTVECCAADDFASGVVVVSKSPGFTAADVPGIFDVHLPPIRHRYLRLKYEASGSAELSAGCVVGVEQWAAHPASID